MWRPLSKRTDRNAAADYDALHDGIPSWLRQSLGTWIEAVVSALTAGGVDPFSKGRLLLDDIERNLRFSFQGERLLAPQCITRECLTDPQRGLDVVDLLLYRLRSSSIVSGQLETHLETVLREAGSAWRVGPDGLEQRVSEEITARARDVIARGSRAATHLREAWHALYGRQPNPSHSYREAVRAVEAAAIPVVCPNDNTATLGKIIGQMRTSPSMWTVSLRPSDSRDPVQVVVSMMELTWKSQLDRHGTSESDAPFSVTELEAEAALHVSLTLVHWFDAGIIQKA